MMAAAVANPSVPKFEEIWRNPAFKYLAEVVAVLFVLGQVVAVLAHWIASKPVADKGDATLRNGFRVWLYHVVAGLLWVIGIAYLLSIVPRNESVRIYIVFGGMLLLALLVIFLIPMKVYRIGFWASLGMLLLSGLMQSAVMTAVQFAALYAPVQGPHLTALRALTDHHLRFVERQLGKSAPDEIDRLLDEALSPLGARQSLREREAAVTTLQRKLEERRRALRPSDAAANAKFQRQLERYKRLLKDVNAERAAGRPG